MSIGADYAFWPSWMPALQESNYSVQPEDVRQATETEVGAIIRPQFSTDVLLLDGSLVLNRMQGAWFEAYERALIREHLWFTMPIWYGGEVHDAVCMLKSRPKWTVEAFATTYQFSVIVQKRSLEMDECLHGVMQCWPPAGTVRISALTADAKSALNGSTITGA